MTNVDSTATRPVDWLSLSYSVAPLRNAYFSVEPSRTMRADGFEWDHEIRVALRSQFNFFRLIILSEKPSDNATSRGYWRKH